MRSIKSLRGIDKARVIHGLRQKGTPWEEIGVTLDEHPEALRSTLRRYQSDIDDSISVLSILDKSFNEDEMLLYSQSKKLIEQINEMERQKGYGKYLLLSDLHGRYRKNHVIKEGIIEAQNRGIGKAVIAGDLFDFEAISKFSSNKDSNAFEEKEYAKELLCVLGKIFDTVIMEEGNHEWRLKAEIARNIKNGYKVFFKDIDAIQMVIDELREEEGINNIYYPKGNEIILGDVIIAHPKHFSSVPGRTVLDLIDTYLMDYPNLSALIIGHTHYDLKKMYKGVAAFEVGCTCYEPDYRKGARKRKDKWVTAYSFIEITAEGKINYNNSQVIRVDD